MRTISIDPVTRLEGHGRIDIMLGPDGRVRRCRTLVTEFRGFEAFLKGRPVEELPRLTSRVCGVCPEAHHAASVKAVEALFRADVPVAAELIRRLQYNAFVAGDHATHFFALGGPDLMVGYDAPRQQRNLLGVIRAVGLELGRRVMLMRKAAHEISEMLGGRRINPVGMVPGGQSRAVDAGMQRKLAVRAEFMLAFARAAQQVFERYVLSDARLMDMVRCEPLSQRVYSMGVVNEHNEPDHYDGCIRVVGPDGGEVYRYDASDYSDYVAERIESWSYAKVPYLRRVGWQGYTDGDGSGVFRVGPLGMLNAAERMQTPLAQEQFERMFETLGERPAHASLAFHWARIVEMLQCAELAVKHVHDERLVDPCVRQPAVTRGGRGIGMVEAPRGVLVHDYAADESGIAHDVNLVVGTTHNYGAIQLAVARAAEHVFDGTVEPDDVLLNRIEMVLRAFDPCFACATHAVGASGGPVVRVHAPDGQIRIVSRKGAGGGGAR